MSNSYVISLNDAINCLNGFVSDMHSEYKKKGVNVQLGYDEERGGAVTSSNPILPVKNVSINVGAKSIFDNAKNGYVRSQDLVYIVSTVFHEERHLQQRAIHIFTVIKTTVRVVNAIPKSGWKFRWFLA